MIFIQTENLNVKPESSKPVQILGVGKHQDGSIGLQSYHPWKSKKKWFGRDKCTAPIAHAGFLAIKGKDCPNILRAFDEALSIESGKSGCGCYDEESTLARMFQLYPHLFEWQGTWPSTL